MGRLSLSLALKCFDESLWGRNFGVERPLQLHHFGRRELQHPFFEQ